MARAVKLSEELFGEAQTQAKVLNRSTAGQIEFWAKMGRLAEENPDLTYTFIRDLLLAKEEENQGATTPYVFGEGG